MCTQKPPHDYSQPLYEKYKETFQDYIISMVSSALSYGYHILVLTLT